MKSDSFKSAHRLAIATVILLIIDITSYFIEIIYSIVYMTYFPDFGSSEVLTTSEAMMSLTALGLMVLRMSSFVVTVVLFLMWLYRAYSNLSPFNVQGLMASPGWAVGYWFIPILNLFRPLQIVNEIYHGSDAEKLKDGYAFSNTTTPAIHGFWWACWLISGFVSRISSSIEKAAKDVTNTSILFDIISLSFGIIAGLLLIFIIQEIDKRQSEFETQSVFSMPPSPPVFNRPDQI